MLSQYNQPPTEMNNPPLMQPLMQNLTKMYEKQTYFDQYGASVFLFIIITAVLIVILTFCFTMIHSQPILDDWPNQRCKLQYLPIAGFITHPEGVSATEYTSQNFTYCMQNILASVTGTAVQPLTFVTKSMQNVVDNIKNSLNSTRAMFDKMRTFFQSVIQEIMGRLLNVMVPLQQIIISFKDLMGKIQGTMTGGLFTLLGSYYTLKSLMGAIAQFIVTILVALAATIAVLWATPFTWSFAAINTGIFLAISIPMAIILAFMSNVMHIKGYTIPKVKCFDKNTKLVMQDGSRRCISNIRVGDYLQGGILVTATMIVESAGSTMYRLGENIIVSNSHITRNNATKEWLFASLHPDAVPVFSYNEPFLYCLNTSSKTIQIDGYLFTDWDAIDNTLLQQMTAEEVNLENNTCNVHKYVDAGFAGDTSLKMLDGKVKCMRDVCVGDILEKGEFVYGVVAMDATQLRHPLVQYLSTTAAAAGEVSGDAFKGSSNLRRCTQRFSRRYFGTRIPSSTNADVPERVLYHLLTDTTSFHVCGIPFFDYNQCVDGFL